MVTAYNFIASWQLFPEKGTYEFGNRPKSGIYKIEAAASKKELRISNHWVTLENQAFDSQYQFIADGATQPFMDIEFADTIKADFFDAISFETLFYKNGQIVLEVLHELLPNGYLSVTQKGYTPEQKSYINKEIYYKQMSVLPYSTSVSGAVIKPTEEGVIRHKALSAMEEQTNMQLDQIRKQIELLALQAQEIQMRKELSMIIYNAKLSFAPVIGSTYYLYEKNDGNHFVSMVSPKEWGGSGPYKSFIAQVKLLADHTWVEV
jgi:predicted transcriptional regulator